MMVPENVRGFCPACGRGILLRPCYLHVDHIDAHNLDGSGMLVRTGTSVELRGICLSCELTITTEVSGKNAETRFREA